MKAIHVQGLVIAAAILLACNGPARASEMDDRIESSFLNSFVYKTYLEGEQITIMSQDGAVTLSGTVVTDINKLMAQHTAEALPGVISVDNRIQLAQGQPDEYSDMWVNMKVKAALLCYRNVSGTKTEIVVKDGIVTLKGEAANQAQKELTTEYAQDVVGVKKVNNEMTVAARPAESEKTLLETIDDASITAQVKGALLLHRSTNALTTGVTVNSGVVTISGKAKNAAEKSLVAKLVMDIHGVKNVVNDMTIEE